MTGSLRDASPYAGYLYSYPHKTAYRPLGAPVSLASLWEADQACALYVHVPFCEMRCGFCNLFTRSRPPADVVDDWLATLQRQARVVDTLLGDGVVDRYAIGGGTPTMLSPGQLQAVLDIVGRFVVGRHGSVETSPATATPERLAVLAGAGVTRVSLGVQSFEDAEVATALRPQTGPSVARALDALRHAGFETLNLDLIYGIPGQTAESWERSLRAALKWSPEELYLYPLYVRPLTGMARRERSPDDSLRMELYRLGRDLLVGEGYEQLSMRNFWKRRRQDDRGKWPRCEGDAMIGLGVGARSYTTGLHFATDYAVGARGVDAIIDAWIARSDADFGVATHGIRLDEAERDRRQFLMRFLALEFVSSVPEDLQTFVARLVQDGLAAWRSAGVQLTPDGVALSDAIGPALISDAVRARMAAWEAR